jgi:hypothetical protein
MQAIMNAVSPSATTQLRADHAHVLTAFHQYEVGIAPGTKRVLVGTICRALEIHATLEEEIFYPALHGAAPGLVEKNVSDHQQIKNLIVTLRPMDPAEQSYDATFLELMRLVMHHVSDEETRLLPEAERLLGDDLNALGADMVVRRAQLTAARAGEIAYDTVHGLPTSLMFAAAGVAIAGSYMLRHALRR